MVQAALDRPGRDAENDGDLDDVEILAVPKCQQLQPVQRQPLQGLRHVAGTFLGRVAVGPLPLSQGIGEIPLPSCLATVVRALVPRNAVGPGCEPRRVAELSDLPQNGNPRFLRGIPRGVVAPGKNPDGRFKLWCELDIRKVPPMGEYVVGVDVSSGIGGSMTSNSAIALSRAVPIRSAI